MADHQSASRTRPELARRTRATETLERARPDAGVHALAEAPFAQHLTPASVLRLQHHQGNQFVLRLLARPPPQPTAVRVSRPIQRLDARQVTVSAKTMERLRLAQDAIQQVNSEILKFGAGNQADDIRKTKGVSLHRTKILADKKDVDWKVTRDLGADERRVQPEPARREILLKYYGASVCDDYGYATFNYLRQIASGQKITRVSSPALHHAYVIIGDL